MGATMLAWPAAAVPAECESPLVGARDGLGTTRSHDLKRLVWLFDVDGTLIRSYGAARESFSAALSAVLGVTDDLDGLAFAGRTDPLILADILKRHQRSLDAVQTERFWAVVRSGYEESLASGRGRVLPGVRPLLEAIAREPTWVPALLTGNNASMARLKLDHFGLADAFVYGAFGDDAPDRDSVARLAVGQARERWNVPAERCIVVGDTELDVQCARAAGARVISVATGVRTRGELEAAGPDLLVDDLSDTAALIQWARGVAAEDGPVRPAGRGSRRSGPSPAPAVRDSAATACRTPVSAPTRTRRERRPPSRPSRSVPGRRLVRSNEGCAPRRKTRRARGSSGTGRGR